MTLGPGFGLILVYSRDADKTNHPRANEAFLLLSEGESTPAVLATSRAVSSPQLDFPGMGGAGLRDCLHFWTAFECLHDAKSQAVYLSEKSGSADGGGAFRQPGHGHHKRKRGGGDAGSHWQKKAAPAPERRARSWAEVERDLARREEAERVLRASFVASQSFKFSSKETERLLVRAQKICRTLDERNSPDEVNPLWATLVEQEVAVAGPTTNDLPEGWEVRESRGVQMLGGGRGAGGGTWYYFHAKTGTSTWEHPDPAVSAKQKKSGWQEGAFGSGEARPAAPEAPRTQLTAIMEYLHSAHDYRDLDDDLEELLDLEQEQHGGGSGGGFTGRPSAIVSDGSAGTGTGSVVVSDGSALAEDEYDY